MTSTREEALVLEHVLCIYYPFQFKKNANETQIQALIDSKSEVNTIHPIFVRELSLSIRLTEVRIQKINGTMLDTNEIVVIAFLVTNKAYQVRFFKETILVANISLKVVFGILFLILSGANIDFLDRELWWKTYTIKKAILTTRHIELVGKKEFIAAVLDPEHETFIVYVTSFYSTPLNANIV